MCLRKIIQFNENIEDHILTAEEDITVYKIVRNLYNNAYQSPFKNHIYRNLELQRKVNLLFERSWVMNNYNVHEGYHSFPDMKSAEKEKMDQFYDFSDEIIPFIIPKGTKYIEGTFEDLPCIVSETIYMKLEK